MRAIGLVMLLALSVGAPQRSEEDLKAILRALRAAPGEEARAALVPRLVALRTGGAAKLLAHLVRQDPSPAIRVAAAAGLGRIPTGNAHGLLVSLVTEGGPAQVRDTVARMLAMREESVPALLEILDGKQTDALTRGLVLSAFGEFRDETSRALLLARAGKEDLHLRGVALRALARRPDGIAPLRTAVRGILRSSRQPPALLQALDAFDAIEIGDGPSLLPLLERLETLLEPTVRGAAEHLAARIRYAEGSKRVREARLDGYGAPAPPPAPPARGLYDIVFAVDLTGSTVVILDDLKERIRREIRLVERLGTSLRVGIVGYRFWKHVSVAVPRREVLPLTFDADRVQQFLTDCRSRGPDSQGADISGGLTVALSRMEWRRHANRVVVLVADSKCHDPKAAKSVVAIHRRADGTRTRVVYALRTRPGVPPELAEIARLGGTGTVELLE